MPQSKQLTRICSSCGQSKPLSAFLQFSDRKGATYGIICSTCRKSQSQEAQKKEQEAEEHTTENTGLKIDAKAKLQMEIIKKQSSDQFIAETQQEKKKKDEITDEKLEKTDQIEKKEKNQREKIFEAKQQQTFMSGLGRKTEAVRQALINQKTKEDTLFAKTVIDEHREKTEHVKGEGNKEELKKSEVDVSKGMGTGYNIRYNSSRFLEFTKYLGKGSALVQSLERAFGNPEETKGEQQKSSNEKTYGPKGR